MQLNYFRTISASDIAILLRELATLLSSGIPIVKSLEIMAHNRMQTAIQQLLQSTLTQLLSGHTLSAAFRQFPLYFDVATCQLIHIGEQTGKLDTILTLLANRQEAVLLLKKRITQALFYPLLITLSSIALLCCMFIFVIPEFAELFDQSHLALPLLTRCLFFISNQFVYFTPFFILFPLFFLLLFLPHPFTRRMKQQCLMIFYQLPLLHTLIKQFVLARFARSLAMTFAAGIPLTEALRLTVNTIHHPHLTPVLAKLHGKISGGFQLYQAIATQPSLPPVMTHLVKIGEESGHLDTMLNQLADMFESSVERRIITLTQLLEPLILIVLGVLIGVLVIGMYLPIFKLGSLI